jgi:hypothetical protein
MYNGGSPQSITGNEQYAFVGAGEYGRDHIRQNPDNKHSSVRGLLCKKRFAMCAFYHGMDELCEICSNTRRQSFIKIIHDYVCFGWMYSVPKFRANETIEGRY